MNWIDKDPLVDEAVEVVTAKLWDLWNDELPEQKDGKERSDQVWKGIYDKFLAEKFKDLKKEVERRFNLYE